MSWAEKEERDTAENFTGVCSPQTWPPTFRLTFPLLLLIIVLLLRLPTTSGHIKRDLKTPVSTWIRFNNFAILMVFT